MKRTIYMEYDVLSEMQMYVSLNKLYAYMHDSIYTIMQIIV